MHEYRARIMATANKKAGLSGASFRKLHIKLIYLIFERVL